MCAHICAIVQQEIEVGRKSCYFSPFSLYCDSAGGEFLHATFPVVDPLNVIHGSRSVQSSKSARHFEEKKNESGLGLIHRAIIG